MPIATVKKGRSIFREAELGTGDITICKARQSRGHLYDNMILLIQDGETREIGSDVMYAGKDTDQIPIVTDSISLVFNRSASVRLLINDLKVLEQNLIADGK